MLPLLGLRTLVLFGEFSSFLPEIPPFLGVAMRFEQTLLTLFPVVLYNLYVRHADFRHDVHLVRVHLTRMRLCVFIGVVCVGLRAHCRNTHARLGFH